MSVYGDEVDPNHSTSASVDILTEKSSTTINSKKRTKCLRRCFIRPVLVHVLIVRPVPGTCAYVDRKDTDIFFFHVSDLFTFKSLRVFIVKEFS